jgi:superfamily II DNA or RNA helicase
MQLTERIKESTSLKVGQLYQDCHDTDYDILVSTWQSMAILIDAGKINSDAFNMILVDECHQAISKDYASVIQWFDCPRLYGFTATWMGKNQNAIINLFGKIIYEKSIFDLIDEGWLTKLKFYIHIDNVSTCDKVENIQYQVKKWVNIEKIIGNKKAKTIHFFSKIKDYPKHLDSYHPISFDVSLKKRKELFDEFNKVDSTVSNLFSCRILNEGIDLPIANTVIFHENVGGFRTFNQRVGRGARIHSTKEHTDVLMFINSKNEEQMMDVTSFVKEIEVAKKTFNLREKGKSYDSYIEIVLLEQTESFINKMRIMMDNVIEYKSLEEQKAIAKENGITSMLKWQKRYKNFEGCNASPWTVFNIKVNEFFDK